MGSGLTLAVKHTGSTRSWELCPEMCSHLAPLADSFFNSEAAVSSLFLAFLALSDLADPRLGCLPVPLSLTHPIRLSNPVVSVNKEKKILGLKGNRRSPCFSVTFNFQPSISVEIEM